MRTPRLLPLIAPLVVAPSAHAQETLATARGYLGVQTEREITLARPEGSISGYDKTTGMRVYDLPTDRRVVDLKVMEGRIYWVPEGSRTVFSYNPATAERRRFDVSTIHLRTSIERISSWQGLIMVQGESEFAFIDPTTAKVKAAWDVLPSNVWNIAKQGPVQTVSQNGSELFVSFRRCGQRNGADSAGGVTDISMVNAWCPDGRGGLKLMGGYTCSLISYRDAAGPKVQVDLGRRLFEGKYGTGDLWNVKLGPEGMIGLGADEVYVVPFFQDSWEPNRVKTAFRPGYAKQMDYCQESAWWTDGRKVYRANLEDGSTDAFLPKSSAKITGVLSDPEGAWVMTEEGVRRIEVDNPTSDYASVSFAAYNEPQTHQQLMLDRALQASGPIRGRNGMRDLLVKAGAPASCMTPVRRTDEAEFGDLIQWSDEVGVYLGAGRILVSRELGAEIRNIEPTADMRYFRVLPRSPITAEDLNPKPVRPVTPRRPNTPRPTYPRPTYPAAPTPTVPSGWTYSSDIYPVGVNRPKPSLGHNQFVRWVPGANFDRPQTENERRLLALAQSWIGTPYRWGGNTKAGVDCSGFVVGVFRDMGIRLPRHSQDIGRVSFGKVVVGDLKFGDVLVFQSPKHVAIYIGGGRTIEAVSGGVGYSSISRRTQAIVRRFI